ncbi:hypothetical protein [Candidatus Thiosymbion oneisti]|uniref:hypothetical protein n=1 Tax=Candidatus Thiosymbion oneisti TaxID=589554 RepID=UPI001A9C85AC|nr:hypothetical protein [Candidatus Thiosymbion oneisti]
MRSLPILAEEVSAEVVAVRVEPDPGQMKAARSVEGHGHRLGNDASPIEVLR